VTAHRTTWRQLSVVLTASLLCLLVSTPLAGESVPQDSALVHPVGGSQTIVLGGGNNYKPFHFVAGGAAQGFDVDLAQAIGRVMGLDLEVKLAYWEDIRDGLESGAVQAHIGMTHSPERADRYDFSSPYLTQH